MSKLVRIRNLPSSNPTSIPATRTRERVLGILYYPDTIKMQGKMGWRTSGDTHGDNPGKPREREREREGEGGRGREGEIERARAHSQET